MIKIRTLATTVRCDARDAAMAHILLYKQDIKPNSVSDLFRECVAIVAELAINQGLIERMTSTEEAVYYLQQNNIIDLLENRPNKAALVKLLSKPAQEKIKEASQHHHGPSEEEIHKAITERLHKDHQDLTALKGFIPDMEDLEDD
jgi:hypothetical protein